MHKVVRIILVTLALSLCSWSWGVAQSVDDAQELFNRGAYAEASALYRTLLEAAPKNGALREKLAESYMANGQYEDALHTLQASKTKRTQAFSLLLARAYFYTYRFGDAIATIDAMGGKRRELASEFVEMKVKAQRANQMLDNCERVEIIDSVQIDRAQLEDFPWGKLSKEWGSFIAPRVLPFPSAATSLVYRTSLGYEVFFSRLSESGDLDLFSSRLVGGAWEEPLLLESLRSSADECNPVLRQDGITLIFARNSGEGIGGYDLYLTRRDTDTGLFLASTLLGMPFNSPFDDLFLIYDDIYQVGVLASDRYCPRGKVHLYTFRINEEHPRVTTNDLESKRPLAALCPWRNTQTN